MITIHGELYSKKNSKMIVGNGSRKYLIPSKAYRVHEKAMSAEVRNNKQKFLDMIADKEKPYSLNIKIYRKTKRRFDYVNIVQGLLDVMVDEKLIDDDNMNEIIPVFHPYEVDKDNPRVDIWV